MMTVHPGVSMPLSSRHDMQTGTDQLFALQNMIERRKENEKKRKIQHVSHFGSHSLKFPDKYAQEPINCDI